MGEQARSAPCVAWVNAKKSIHAPSIQPFLFAAGNLRNMTNPFSEYSQFDALTVSDLIFFVSLFESRSLSNTAAEGGLSLSTASRTLRKLRETFGDPLFLRSSPDFVPTSRATELYPKVAMLLENLRRLERPACFDPATLTRTFRIGVVDNAVCAVMSGVVKAFFEAAPRASLSFRQITDSLFDDLADGTLDCAVYPETRSIPSGSHRPAPLSDQLRALRSQETSAGRGLPRKGRGHARHAPPLAQDLGHEPRTEPT